MHPSVRPRAPRGLAPAPAALLLALVSVGAFHPLHAQEDGADPLVAELVAFVPEGTAAHDRSGVRAGVTPDGYPAVEAEFAGPQGAIHLSIVFEDAETGRAARMLRSALEQGDAEPWEFGGVEAYRLALPARAPGQADMEQRLVRVEGPERDAWIVVAGPEGGGEHLAGVLEALDLERLEDWMEGLGARVEAGG